MAGSMMESRKAMMQHLKATFLFMGLDSLNNIFCFLLSHLSLHDASLEMHLMVLFSTVKCLNYTGSAQGKLI